MKELIKELSGLKEVLILGFGKEGQSTCQFIRRHFPDVRIGIADKDPGIAGYFTSQVGVPDVILHLGDDYLSAMDSYPLIIKSPGVALPPGTPRVLKDRVTSQTDLMLKAFHRQVIGVTGTKGKSTTSSLIHHILKEAGRDTVLVGNIGLPPFDQLDRIGDSTLVVFEMSSHQLEDTSHAPSVAVLLNLYPEHLDRYPTLHAYYAAKMNILYRQEEDDVFIFNEDIPEIAHGIAGLSSRRKFFSFSSGIRVQNGCFLSGDDIYLSRNGKEALFGRITEEYALKGKHNRMNMMAAILATRAAGVEDLKIRDGLKSFRGLEHRLEYVGKFRDIHFYNDSIATIPEAAMEAVKALPDTDTILLGGYDRGLDYRRLMDFLSESDVRNLIFLGQAGRRMHDLLRLRGQGDKNLFLVQNLEEAFEKIPAVTRKEKICLLSPAAASYDIFRNFEERGRIFKTLARSL